MQKQFHFIILLKKSAILKMLIPSYFSIAGISWKQTTILGKDLQLPMIEEMLESQP